MAFGDWVGLVEQVRARELYLPCAVFLWNFFGGRSAQGLSHCLLYACP